MQSFEKVHCATAFPCGEVGKPASLLKHCAVPSAPPALGPTLQRIWIYVSTGEGIHSVERWIPTSAWVARIHTSPESRKLQNRLAHLSSRASTKTQAHVMNIIVSTPPTNLRWRVDVCLHSVHRRFRDRGVPRDSTKALACAGVAGRGISSATMGLYLVRST